jgi:hypothetical protein
LRTCARGKAYLVKLLLRLEGRRAGFPRTHWHFNLSSLTCLVFVQPQHVGLRTVVKDAAHTSTYTHSSTGTHDLLLPSKTADVTSERKKNDFEHLRQMQLQCNDIHENRKK